MAVVEKKKNHRGGTARAIFPGDLAALQTERGRRPTDDPQDNRCLKLAENVPGGRVLSRQIGETGQHGAQVQAAQDRRIGKRVARNFMYLMKYDNW
jgi:hypothetical protein